MMILFLQPIKRFISIWKRRRVIILFIQQTGRLLRVKKRRGIMILFLQMILNLTPIKNPEIRSIGECKAMRSP